MAAGISTVQTAISSCQSASALLPYRLSNYFWPEFKELIAAFERFQCTRIRLPKRLPSLPETCWTTWCVTRPDILTSSPGISKSLELPTQMVLAFRGWAFELVYV